MKEVHWVTLDALVIFVTKINSLHSIYNILVVKSETFTQSSKNTFYKMFVVTGQQKVFEHNSYTTYNNSGLP